jgi:Flp pilus assembly protein CpaB
VKRSNRLILLIGVLLAAVAFVAIIYVFNSQSSGGNKPILTTNVVVATKDIPLGETLVADMLGTKQIDTADKKSDQYADPGEIIGQVVRTDVVAGAIMTQAMFVGSGAPNLGKDLPSGYRAVAVRVDGVTGVGTLINVGDRVDVVMTVEMTPVSVTPGEGGAAPVVSKQDALTGKSSKVLIQNIEVRGIVGTVPTSTDGTTAATGDPLTTQQIVILSVTPQQAEVLQFVQQQAVTMGTAVAGNNLTLVLRSPKDKDAPPDETTGIVLETLISKYGVLPPGILEPNIPGQ